MVYSSPFPPVVFYIALGIIIILYLIKRSRCEDLEKTYDSVCIQLNKFKEKQSNLESELKKTCIYIGLDDNLSEENNRINHLFDTLRTNYKNLSAENSRLSEECSRQKEYIDTALSSNTIAMPWLAGMMGDLLTLDIEAEAKKLDWGSSKQRAQKAASIRAIRAEARRRIEEAKLATYQLEYLLELYPSLSDVLETDFSDLEFDGSIPDDDPVRRWLSKEEWHSLSEDERNQLALDRYIQSHKKNKWQIGRDYEMSVAYELYSDGFSVDSFGNYKKLEDMGRDIIAVKNGTTYIFQCKYWSEAKIIHEKHIYQLYGTSISYSLENPNSGTVIPVFVTNIHLSKTAKEAAKLLKVQVRENHKMIDFPRIKCNIGKDEFGQTFIYHLPMDNQYDTTQIKKPGEFYAFTVKEAVEHGFRRSYKWQGSS